MKLQYSVLPASVDYRRPGYDELRAMFDKVSADYAEAQFPGPDATPSGHADTDMHAFALVQLAEGAVGMVADEFRELFAHKRRLASFEEMLGFARRYPDIQRQVRIVAPGTSIKVDDDECVPVLEGDRDTRSLSLIEKSVALTELDCLLTVLL